MSWLLITLLAAGGLGVHLLCFKYISHYFSPLWGTILYMQLIVLLLLPVGAYFWHTGADKPDFSWPGAAAVAALALTGIFYLMFFIKAFQVSPSPSMVPVITNVGAIVISVVLVSLLFNDSLTPLRIAGVAMAVGGIALALKG